MLPVSPDGTLRQRSTSCRCLRRCSCNRGKLKLDGSFTISTDGDADARLQRAILRLQQRLEGRTGIILPLGIAPSGTPGVLTDHGEDRRRDVSQVWRRRILCAGNCGAIGATLSANTVWGAMHGMETLLQLVAGRFRRLLLPSRHHSGQTALSVARTDDRRGAPLRAGRRHQAQHRRPGCGEDERLPLAPERRPGISHREQASTRSCTRWVPADSYYTQEQVREVVAYAADRGVRVIPEFDMPGHAGAWMVGYPELASAPGPYEIQMQWGIFDPAMDPTREETYKFLDGFIGEMAALFPDEYFHIGGDENNGKQWQANPQDPGIHAGTRLPHDCGVAGLLQPAGAEDRAEARQEDGGLGRDPDARSYPKRRWCSRGAVTSRSTRLPAKGTTRSGRRPITSTTWVRRNITTCPTRCRPTPS